MTDLRIKLLQKQREKGLTGFTIPYLIGANRSPIGKAYKDEQLEYGEFIEFLNFFQSSQNIFAGISECVKLKEPVLALYKSQEAALEHELEAIKSNGTKSSLFASSQYQHNQNFDSLVEHLWEQFKEPILQGKFSFENGQYIEFTDNDIGFITEASNNA